MPASLLAADNTAETSGVGDVVFWVIVLILVVVAMFMLVIWIKKWLATEEDATTAGTGFALSDLRRLHKEGKMSTEEFERAKGMIITTHKASAAKQPPPKSE